MEIKKQRVEIDGDCIYYQTMGAGQPLILIHGLSGSTRWWAKNIRVLADYYRVHIIDLIGFGRSRGSSRFILDRAAEVVARWMDYLGMERAHLIGHSMGGYISAELAVDYPRRVDHLVLVDAAGLPFGCNLLKHALGLFGAMRYLPLDFWPVLITDALRAGPITILSAMRQILSSNLQVKLSRIDVPTLIVWGEHDTLMPVIVGEQLSQAIPQAEFVVLEGAGHNPMWDRARMFNDLVLDFLKEERRREFVAELRHR